MDHREIVASLRSLSRSQLEDVRRRAALYLQHSKPSTVEDEDWLLIGIRTELSRRGLESRDTFRLKKPSSFASYQTQSETVRSLLLSAAPDLTAVQRRALGEIAAKALADFLTSWQKPPTISREALLRRVSRVPEALDWAYPGYMAAGLLGVVVR